MLVGTPTRDELEKATRAEAAAFFGLEEKKRTAFIFGGSLGAASINDAMVGTIGELLRSDFQVIWQTGATDFNHVQSAIRTHPGVWIGAYIDRMELAYALADVVVSRAGATTIAEVTRLGKATIFVPLPHAAEDHQMKNAMSLVQAGGGMMILDNQVRTRLFGELKRLLEDEGLRVRTAMACRAFGKPEAGRVIAETILQMIR
jgi:UDP-N-acetylglucosamine--N-acetylmuramyl-(pentapeptide) pyrophosphoryl-undecaprenol N-acetylglucosamine transferase